MKLIALFLIALLATSCSSVTKSNTAENGTINTATTIDPATGLPWGNWVVDPVTGLPPSPDQPAPPPPPLATTRRPCSSADTDHQQWSITPVSPQEVQTGRDRLRRVRSDMALKRVLATLGLSRFRGHARSCEGPADIAVSLDLASDHVLEAHYERKPSGWVLYWVALDEAFWYPGEERLSEATHSSVDIREQGHPISPPVTAEELERAKEGLKLLRTDFNLRQVLATLGLSRCRGHFGIGAGSISLSVHGDLGNGHKLDMIYDRPTYSPGWKLSWVGIDWQDNQTGFGHWEAADSIRK